jgi:PAS domain S-box-containing protein
MPGRRSEPRGRRDPPSRGDEPARGKAEAEAFLMQMASAFFPGGDPSLEEITWPEPAPAAPEERLRAAEQRFRTLVEQIPAVTFMAVLGEGKNEIYVSPHIEALLGYSQREWLEDPFLWYERLHPDDRTLWNDEFTRGLQHGGPFRAECRFVARDGRTVWVHGEARLLRDERGRPSMLQGVAFDITDNKRAHAVLLERAVDAARVAEELAIAQRVQTSILPRKLAVPGLEIAARMIPAAQVGGDYYDILPTEDGCWIGIGDVSGHGLDAGLVMLMLQSSISSAVLAQPGSGPGEILRTVNLALVQNIRGRLGSRDHVTLSLLRYTPDGRFVYAGAHEEMIVVRRRGGVVVTIATPGTWLGARKDVGRFFVDNELRLDDGDLLVLYTDGITEARDEAGTMFDLDRLVESVRAVAHKPAVLVRDNILADARRFMARQEDDMTLIVIRYRAP